MTTTTKKQKPDFWHTNKDTVLGTIVCAAVTTLTCFVNGLIKDAFHKKRNKDDFEAHKKKKEFDNDQKLKAYKKMEILEAHKSSESSSKQMSQEGCQPLNPVLHNPSRKEVDIKEKRLFASAIHVGDCGIVSGPKGVGKTILMMQIARSIAEGTSTGLWPQFDEGTHEPQKVLYYDAELKDADMYNRYFKYSVEFPQNFMRFDKTQFDSIDDVLRDLDLKIPAFDADTTIIIDNVTKLLETEQPGKVNDFNRKLEKIHICAGKQGIQLTIILVAHVGKDYKTGKSIEIGDIAGAANLTNFLDFVIALEKPLGKYGHLALRVLNSRSESEPDDKCLLKLSDQASSYAHFEFERETDKNEKYLAEAKAMKEYMDKGHSQEETAKEFRRCRQTVINRLNKLKGQ